MVSGALFCGVFESIWNDVGELTSDGRLIFGNGKTTSFKMHSEDLRAGLLTKPFYVMFIDADAQKLVHPRKPLIF
jgi:hypothetical protein